MAEFCLDCWNELNGTKESEKKYIMSDYLDLCEGCGKLKSVIITTRKHYYMKKYKYTILPFKINFYVILFLWRILTLPYLLYITNKDRTEE